MHPSWLTAAATAVALALLVTSTPASGASAQVVVPMPSVDPLPEVAPSETTQYVYVLAPPGAERAATLNARLLELQTLRDQQRIGGPVAMVVIGSLVTSFSGLAAMGFGLGRALSSDDFGPSGTDLVRGSRVSGVFFVGGAVMMGFGSARLSQRRRARRQLDPEIFQLHQELRMLQWNGAGFHVAPGSAVAEFHCAF